MILYTDKNVKIQCTKCKPPKLVVNGINMFDFIGCFVDEKTTDFYFSMKNNASNFYFQYNNEWYRTPISTDEFDLMDYLEEDWVKRLFTQEIEIIDNNGILSLNEAKNKLERWYNGEDVEFSPEFLDCAYKAICRCIDNEIRILS